MSAASQFFGGGGGNLTPSSGDDLRVHLLVIGGGGSSSPGAGNPGGGGGAGRLIEFENAIVSTGCTINIDVGQGGAAAQNSPGAATTLTYVSPAEKKYGYFSTGLDGNGEIKAPGGGGSQYGGHNTTGYGLPGGSGGGTGYRASPTPTIGLSAGNAVPEDKTSSIAVSGSHMFRFRDLGHPGGLGPNSIYDNGAGGGGAGSPGEWGSTISKGGTGMVYNFEGFDKEYARGGGVNDPESHVTGITTYYGEGGSGNANNYPGGAPGAVFLRYPTYYAEASAVSGHNTGISTSVTPGYYTYVWSDSTTPGSITF